MHKYLLLLIGAALALPAQAQTERGSKLLGLSVGNLTYRSTPNINLGGSSDDNYRSFSAAVYPSVGWFVVDRLALGAGLPLGYSRTRTNYTATTGPVTFTSRTWTYGLAPFARYYFLDASKHKLFGQLGGEVLRDANRNETRETGNTPRVNHYGQTSTSWLAGVGYNYFLTSNAALEVAANYVRNTDQNYLGGPARGSLNVRLGLSVFLPSGQGN